MEKSRLGIYKLLKFFQMYHDLSSYSWLQASVMQLLERMLVLPEISSFHITKKQNMYIHYLNKTVFYLNCVTKVCCHLSHKWHNALLCTHHKLILIQLLKLAFGLNTHVLGLCGGWLGDRTFNPHTKRCLVLANLQYIVNLNCCC